MTLNRLIKELQKLQVEGHGRWPVACDKTTLWDGNGTFEICDVVKVEAVWVTFADDDGFHVENKDGTERMVKSIVLKGHNHD